MNILVLAAQGLGDALEATPLLAMIRRNIAAARITVAVTRSGPAALFRSLPDVVDGVIELPFWDAGIRCFGLTLMREVLRSPGYDVAMTTYPSARYPYHVIPWLLRARQRLVHRYWAPSWSNGLRFATDFVDIRPVHNAERNLDLLRFLGYDITPAVRYVAPETWKRGFREDRVIALHVGSVGHGGLSLRRWPVESFAELGRRWIRRGFRVAIIAGPSEWDESVTAAEAVPGSELVNRPLPEVARFLSTCSLLVANDNGIAHLAAAVGTPVVALFGPTPIEHGPLAPDAVALRPSSCPPCFDPRYLDMSCKKKIAFRCLREDLSVDVADGEIQRVLFDRYGANGSSSASS